MFTAGPSVAVATVTALVAYSFGRFMRSPLRRWRRRRYQERPNSEPRNGHSALEKTRDSCVSAEAVERLSMNGASDHQTIS